jgi:nicotinamidase-related amidase
VRLDPASTVVLTCDFQVGFIGISPRFADAVRVAARVAAAARAAGVTVLHAGIDYLPGFPEVDRDNTLFAAAKTGDYMQRGTADVRWEDSICHEGDWTFTRCRVGAFSGSRLPELLRGRHAQAIVLCGIATSGVVLSTVRQAADLDHRIVVVADACADRDAEVHRVLLEKVFPTQATVVSADEVVAAWT